MNKLFESVDELFSSDMILTEDISNDDLSEISKDLKVLAAEWLEKDLDLYREEWDYENKNMASWMAKDLKISDAKAWSLIDDYFTEEYYKNNPDKRPSEGLE